MSAGQAQACASDNHTWKNKVRAPARPNVPKDDAKHFVHRKDSQKTVASLGNPIGREVDARAAVNYESGHVRGQRKNNIRKKPRAHRVRAVTNHDEKQRRQKPRRNVPQQKIHRAGRILSHPPPPFRD